MRHQFTTISDVVDAVLASDPGFDAELTHEQVTEIVQSIRTSRYEDISDDEFASFVAAAYVACGADVVA